MKRYLTVFTSLPQLRSLATIFSIGIIIRLRREKTCLRGLETTKAQTSLPIRAVRSAPLLFSYLKVSYLDLLRAKVQFSSLCS